MENRHEGLLDLVQRWDGLGVVSRYDAPTGSWMFVALHDDTLGTPVGGCRMKVYPRPEDGLKDALRLAEGMTHKWAAIDFPFGGGKAVLAVPRPLEGEERVGLLHRFGALLNGLGGAFGTGEDLGTTPEDMRELATVTEHVVGRPRGPAGPTDPGPFTALGVRAGIEAALRHRASVDGLRGCRILIQGVGDVGEPLARLCAAAGATLLLADLDEARAMALAVELGGKVVSADGLYDEPCDVYAPCARGRDLERADDSTSTLRCRGGLGEQPVGDGGGRRATGRPRHPVRTRFHRERGWRDGVRPGLPGRAPTGGAGASCRRDR